MPSLCWDDWHIGHKLSSCREFNLTWTQESLFSLVPDLIFICLSWERLSSLRGRDALMQSSWKNSMILGSKLLFALAALATSVPASFMAPFSAYSLTVEAATLKIDVLANLHVFLLTYLEHSRTFSTGNLLPSFLSVSIAVDAIRLRTYELVEVNSYLYGCFAAAMAAKACLLLLENVDKRSILAPSTKVHNMEETASFFSRVTLNWFAHYLWIGWADTIKLADLGEVDDDDIVRDYHQKFDEAWQMCQNKTHPLSRALWRSLGRELLWPVLPLCGCLIRMAAPLLLGLLLKFLDSWKGDSAQPVQIGWALVIGYGLVTFGDSLCAAAFLSRRNRFFTRISTLIQGTVFEKALRIDVPVANELGSGALSSYISVDVERISDGIGFLYSSLEFTLVTTLGISTLWYYFGNASLGVLLAMLLVSAAIPLFSGSVLIDQSLWSTATDNRVKLITSIIHCMKAIKLQAYEVPILNRYMAARQDELIKQRKYRRSTVLIGQFANIAYALLRMSFFLILALAAKYNYGQFNYTSVFISFNVLEALTGSFWNLTWDWGAAISAISSIHRIESFLLKSEKQVLGSLITFGGDIRADAIVQFENASLGMKADNTTILKDITAHIPKNKLTAVIGHTASGKSSFLHAILSEIDLLQGDAQVPTDVVIAYASQTPYLPAAETIKDNIVYHSSFDSAWYNNVLRLVCLDVDIKAMEEGGEVPTARLSGGQRARVVSVLALIPYRAHKRAKALARAVYAKGSVNLLDDTLSALDNETSAQVFNNLLGAGGALRGSTNVIVTNDPGLLGRADHIIKLANGSVLRQGDPSVFLDHVTSSRSPTPRLEGDPNVEEESKETTATLADNAIDTEASLTTGNLLDAVTTQFKLIGIRLTLFSLCIVAVWSFQNFGIALYLRAWSKVLDFASVPWIGGWIALTSFFASGAVVWWYVWKVVVPMTAAREIHQRQIHGYIRASAQKLQEFSSSFMVNRFSADVYAYEMEFLSALAEGLAMGGEMIPQFIIAIAVTRWAALALLLFLIGGYATSRIYAATQTQIRSLEAAAKTPLYAAIAGISETNGLRVCRAFRKQDELLRHTRAALADVRRPAVLLKLGMSFYAVVLGFCVTVIALTLVSSAVIYRQTSNDLLALALVQLCVMGSLIEPVFNCLADVDTHSVGVERIKFVASLPIEDEKHSVLESSNEVSVPTAGDICFDKVSLRYSREASPALSNINLCIKAGQKVGICGRSGSGKSSLLSCLFRLVDIEAGGTISIGGRDITSVSRYALRKALTIIPQDPLLLEVSIRENLDVEGTRTDNEIWTALEQTGVKSIVERLPNKLDYQVDSHGGSISQGHRQLLALARAHLRQRKILCLDEASSSVDTETDQVMQKALREAHDTTMLVVAHRVSTIIDMDHIILLDGGQIVESGRPQDLLKVAGGKFARLTGAELEA